eukprot:404440-Prymnesium_polylepis.2
MPSTRTAPLLRAWRSSWRLRLTRIRSDCVNGGLRGGAGLYKRVCALYVCGDVRGASRRAGPNQTLKSREIHCFSAPALRAASPRKFLGKNLETLPHFRQLPGEASRDARTHWKREIRF